MPFPPPRAAAPAPGADPDGLLLVDKPAGMTSSDVVVAVRRMFRLRKVGHAGTLDPQATGLLLLLVGRGTKFCTSLMGGDKTYEGTLRLGAATTTQDAEGEVVSGSDPSGVARERLEALVASDFTGDIFQTPPMVSAIKVNGVPLYKMARKGEEVAREPRLVHVFSFRIDDFALPDVLAALRRTRSGRFSVADAIALDDLRALPRADLPSRLLPLSALS